ncbi:MAG TPA: hypothetical protein VIV59_06360 [Anaeromyxobacteraceae bacterium]
MRALAALCLAVLAPAARAEPGAVDWQRRVVKCTGTGAPNVKAAGGNVAVARIGAEKAARLDALRNCMEAVKGVTVRSGETVGGAVAADPGLKASVEGAVQGFRQVGAPRYFSDGGVEIDVEVPLDGKLSEALMPRGEGAPAGAAAPGDAGPTGLIVDARGQGLVPALAPRLLDESGREVYGPAALSPEARRGSGAAYARDVEAARRELKGRVGERPLVVTAAGARGSDVVLKDAQAEGLRGARFLAEGRVVIVADGGEGKKP